MSESKNIATVKVLKSDLSFCALIAYCLYSVVRRFGGNQPPFFILPLVFVLLNFYLMVRIFKTVRLQQSGAWYKVGTGTWIAVMANFLLLGLLLERLWEMVDA